MTSRYSLTSEPGVIAAVFGLSAIDPFPPRRAIAPTEPIGVVRLSLRGQREFQLVRWGLIPGWVKDPTDFSTLFVARAETAGDKPSFRGGLRHRRCLVPADGFYAWSGDRGRRTAYRCRLRQGGPMAMAGIWEHWMGADGSEIDTAALLTVAANGAVASVADRMPIILDRGDWDGWLDCRAGEAVSVGHLLRPGAEGALLVEEVREALPRNRLRPMEE